MKKRLLSMLVCAFILVPVFLTGCSDTDETLTVEQTKASAITLTLYSIVAVSYTHLDVYKRQDRYGWFYQASASPPDKGFLFDA